MAKIIVFEDSPTIRDIIKDQLEPEHDIVATGTKLSEAWAILGRVVREEIDVDVILLDGNLAEESEDPVHSFERHPLAIPPHQNRLLAQRTESTDAPTGNSVHGSSYEQPGRDAKAIIDVAQRYGLIANIIGISFESMEANGVKVDYDLTKDNLAVLAEAVTSVLEAKTE
jgi:hypothetical protein